MQRYPGAGSAQWAVRAFYRVRDLSLRRSHRDLSRTFNDLDRITLQAPMAYRKGRDERPCGARSADVKRFDKTICRLKPRSQRTLEVLADVFERRVAVMAPLKFSCHLQRVGVKMSHSPLKMALRPHKEG